MKKLQWQHSLLAIAISSAAMAAMAQDYDVTAGETLLSGFVTDVNVTGKFTSIQGAPNFVLGRNLFANDVNNNATIQVYTDGARPFELVDSYISGSVLNAGQLKTNGPLSSSLSLVDTLVGGSVRNTGTLNSIGREVVGLNVFNSGIGANLENTGEIFASGTSAIGVSFSGTKENIIEGGVINSGTVSANGEGAVAFNIHGASISESVNNSRLISSTSIGLAVTDSKVGDISNSGNITARGAGTEADPTAVGVYLKNVQGLDGDGNATDLTLNNSRSIDSAGVGIKIDDADSVVVINSTSLSTITGKTAAIEGNGHTVLNMAGGNINGDLVGIDQLNVSTVGRFTGSKIDAKAMNLGNDSNTYLTVGGTKLTGDLNVASGAKLDMQLSDATVPTDPYLEVGGAASFAADSAVTVSSKVNAFNPTNAGVEYVLVKANSLSDAGLKVASNSYLLDVKSFVTDGTTIKAVVAAKSDEDIGNIEEPEKPGSGGSDTGTGNGGGDTNTGGSNTGGTEAPGQAQNGATGALLAMKNSVLGQLDTADPVYQALANASTREEVAQIAKQLTPEVNGGSSRAAVSGQTIVTNAISNRVAGMRAGMSSGEAFQGAGVWVQALSANGDQDSRGGVDGFSSNSAGIAVGVDGKLNDQATVGVAYSYLNTNVTSDSGDKTEVQGSSFTLYGSYELGNWFADASLTAGTNDNDSKRYIVGTQAKGSYDSDVLSANLLGGYDFRFDNLVVEPRIGARYTNVKIDGYKEHGSSAALTVGAQRFEVGEFGAGVRVAGDFPVGMGNLEPEATLMAWHDVIGDKVSSTSSFVLGGNPFVTSGASPVRDSYEATVGATYRVGAVTVGATYGYQTKTDFDGDTVTGRVRYDF
ncbi:TPA: autotransporter domain-containing protein [Pseudomonas aeruginosa]|nr:autotransporter outer membrane beta-barrel domain-containing protein [Pseudomonas aeruginosa]